ncbi:DUF1513 domain-containing protein [Tateyamaria sp. SN6-1]|uniref:DUF1513 domain-containing protein n=1 Tax=Tateyamaria sp. SN6-1 TaxID=3092148 RepID=UPI0039F5C493
MLAAGLVPKPTWADAGSPDFLSAAMKPDGSYVLCGLSDAGSITFEIALPDRGHAAAAHPTVPEAVAFARRPGTFAIILDCRTGQTKARLKAPLGRHFYGHGIYSADGDLLFTTENDYEAAAGIVGVWDVRKGYARIGEFSSGGKGPHDIKLMPDGATLVVANGGIETHPETGRTKLNLHSMRSNLSYLALDGEMKAQVDLASEHQRNSIRHLAVSDSGDVAFAMQWQGDLTDDLPLLGVHSLRRQHLHLHDEASVRAMQGYLGSIAFNSDTNQIATTSPRSGVVQVFGPDGSIETSKMVDVCGVAASANGFVLTSGTGIVHASIIGDVRHQMAWDNHLIEI